MRLSKKTESEIAEMFENEVSSREIAFELDVDDKDVERVIKKINKQKKEADKKFVASPPIDVPTKLQVAPKEETRYQKKLNAYREKLQKLSDEGYTAKEIALLVGKGEQTIIQYCRKYDIPLKRDDLTEKKVKDQILIHGENKGMIIDMPQFGNLVISVKDGKVINYYVEIESM